MAIGRGAGWLVLALAVLCLHMLVLSALRATLAPVSLGAMQRMAAVYTRSLPLSAQPVRAAAAAAPGQRRAAPAAPVLAPAAAQAASGPAPAASDPWLPVDMPQGLAPVLPPPAVPASAAPVQTLAASGPAGALAPLAQASAPAFEWPTSTRIRYRLNGWYRGEISGVAQVEWLRAGDRYQVHLDVDAGVVARRMSSEGRITAAGLEPLRYEESTKVMLAQPRLLQLRFDAHEVVLASGEVVPRPGAAGELQDAASQFIQMIYVFTTRPELLRPGGAMGIQLALPHRVRPWVYEVGAMEWTESPDGGWLESWPVRPQAQAATGTSAASELSVEVWLAPRLQMLPVRIRIRQGVESYLDLHIERLPEQATPP